MKGQNLYLNILFSLTILSLHLPVWFNGRHASFLASIYTIVLDNLLGGEGINSITILAFLMPLYVLYYLVFKIIDSSLIKVLILIILFLAILPFGAMLPPR